jgi:hypothetical protein
MKTRELPFFTPRLVIVGHRDHLAPLVSLISANGERLNLVYLSRNIETLYPICLLCFLPIQWLQITAIVGTVVLNTHYHQFILHCYEMSRSAVFVRIQ